MSTLVAVPVKDLANAKQRLIPLLSAAERHDLASAMLEDVLETLARARLGAVLVVTRDREVESLALKHGAELLREDVNRGHTEAVAHAQREAAARGVKRFLTIPGDVPCATPGELAALDASVVDGPAIAFVPSLSGYGTNAVLLAPPDSMALKFRGPHPPRIGRTPRRILLPGDHARHRRARGPHPPPRTGAVHSKRGPAPTTGGTDTPGLPPRDTLTVPRRYEVVGIEGLPEIHRGDGLAGLLAQAAHAQGTPLEAGDLLVVSQKIVSKTEGRIVNLGGVVPSREAAEMAAEIGRDPRLVEVILGESRRVVRKAPGVLIVETRHGWICANAGVDQSNVDLETACLLPEDSDRSARQLREALRRLTGHDLGIIVADTFGRPWREGLTNVAIGVAGIEPIKSYLGEKDPAGYVLQATILAVADELAAAAEPIMGKLDRIPVVIIPGLDWPRGETGSRALIRDPARDLFR